MYLWNVLQKYCADNIAYYTDNINQLKIDLKKWAGTCYLDICNSGSYAKGTAISLSSDIDLLISLTNNCNETQGGLKSIYVSLYNVLAEKYQNTRKQNVSIRIKLPGVLLSNGLEIDVTPARKQIGNTNVHSLWVSKLNTWKQTNIQKHISDVSKSGRTNEIKLLKIWKELNGLEFPSIYLEYLLINIILANKPKNMDNLTNNFWHILLELAKLEENPLLKIVIDPANSSNKLSDLLKKEEKHKIFTAAQIAISKKNWHEIIW